MKKKNHNQAQKLLDKYNILHDRWQVLDTKSFTYSNSDIYEQLENSAVGKEINDQTRNNINFDKMDIENEMDLIEDKIEALGFKLDFRLITTAELGYELMPVSSL